MTQEKAVRNVATQINISMNNSCKHGVHERDGYNPCIACNDELILARGAQPKMSCSLPWSPERLAQIRRERANFDEENLTALRATRPHFILCEECSGTGTIEDEGRARNCPVCDGTPMITFELVKQYAEQIDSLRKQLQPVGGL